MTAGSWSGKPPFAVLLTAYGSPERPDEVEPYLRDVRGGRAPEPELVEELRARYAAIGGRSPLLERTQEQAAALSRALGGAPVYAGMRHWRPYIADTLAQVAAAGHRRVVVLPLAPHYSTMSVGAYHRAVEAARNGLETRLVESWHDHPAFLDAVASRVREALDRLEPAERAGAALLFTAHSLPARIVAAGDPYHDQLQASVAGVRRRLHPRDAWFAYQSAGRAAGPWLGPEAGAVLTDLAHAGHRAAVVCPIGFVSDHLEVLYDLDIELAGQARELGVRLVRADSLNAHPLLIAALADLAARAARDAGWV